LSYQTLSGSLNGRPIHVEWQRQTPSAVVEIHDTPDTKKHLVHLEFGLGRSAWTELGPATIEIKVYHNGDQFDRVLRLELEPTGPNDGGIMPYGGSLDMLVDNTQTLGDSRILIQVLGLNTGSSSAVPNDNRLTVMGYAQEVA